MELFKLFGKIVIDSQEAMEDIDNASNKAKDTGSKLEKLGGAFKTVGETVSNTGKKFVPITLAVGGLATTSVKTAADFDSAMSQVAATMGMTAEEINNGSEDYKRLEQAARDMGKATMFSASDAADALNYLALAGYDVDKSIDTLPQVLNLAAAGGIDLAYASDMVTDAMSALGDTAGTTENFVDKMAKTSQKSNTSIAQLGEAILTVGGTAKNLAGGTTELNTALGILANNGIKGAEGGTALRNIILSLSAPIDNAAAKMEELGLQVFDTEGNMRPLNDVFSDLNLILKDMDGSERINVLNTIFNKLDLKSANALLGNTCTNFDEVSESLKQCTIDWEKFNSVPTESRSVIEGFINDALYNLGNGMLNTADDIAEFSEWISDEYGISIEDATVLTKKFLETADTNTTAWDDLASKIDSCDNAAQNMADTMQNNLNGKITTLKSALSEAAISIGDKLIPFIEKGVAIIQDWTDEFNSLDESQQQTIIKIALLVAAIAPMLLTAGKVISSVGGMIETFSKTAQAVGTLKGGLTNLAPALGGISAPVLAVIAVIAALAGIFVYLWNTNEEFRTNMINTWNEIVATCSPLLEELKTALNDLWQNVLKPFIDFVGQMLAPVFQIAFQLIGEQFSAFLTVLIGVIEFISGVFSGDWEKAWSGIKKIFSGIWQGIQSLTTNCIKIIQNIVQSGLELVKMYFQSKLNAALNVVNGILDRIKDKFNNTMDNAKNIVNKGIELIKKAFNFTWKLPPLKLPHFSIDGSFSLNPPAVPKFGIEWYKNGGILTEPTAFGLNPFSGNTMVGGEAGHEAIAPIDVLLDYIRTAVAEQNSGLHEILNRLVELIETYMPELILSAKKQIVLDNGVLVGELAPGVDREIGGIADRKERWNA